MSNTAHESVDPSYLIIEKHLRSLILSGAGRDEPLPAEPELARQFNVSRMTARHAYQRLVNEGIVTRRRGAGSFVNGRMLESLPVTGIPDFSGWTESSEIRRIVNSYCLTKVKKNIAVIMGVASNANVTRLERIREVNGVLSLDIRYLPQAFHKAVSVQQIEKESLLTLLKDAGYSIASGEVEIEAVEASEDIAALLRVTPGKPLLKRKLFYRDNKNNIVLLGESYYPANKASFKFTFDDSKKDQNISIG